MATGAYAVGAGNPGNLTEIVIPATYNGKPVTMIDENAFADAINLTSIIIPDSVKIIGEGAFSGCTSLESITLFGWCLSHV